MLLLIIAIIIIITATTTTAAAAATIVIATSLLTPHRSLSMDELIYVFKGLLPSLRPPPPPSFILVDVGSRLGGEHISVASVAGLGFRGCDRNGRG